ncbi:MAG: cation-translocating P-type ATPase [Chlamydiia bacterium]
MSEEIRWYNESIERAFELLGTDIGGLSSEEAKKRLESLGANVLEERKGRSLWALFFRQFLNPLVMILLLACAFKFFIYSITDGVVLLSTLMLMAIIGFIQEAKAEKAMEALKKLSAYHTRVKRDGHVIECDARELVPGDVIILEPGDRIPADARIIETVNLKINESTLTGESVPVEKVSKELENHPPLVDRINMLYMGTSVSCGKATALITATGMGTELGKIATSLKDIEEEKTPLQKNVEAIGFWILPLIGVAILFFIWVSIEQGLSIPEIFLLSVSAAVSAIPEGLPASFTITLALGMSEMAKKHAIIRKLLAVETLGSTTLIASDKTGTLTLNQMKVTEIYIEGHEIIVEGDGDSAYGSFHNEGGRILPEEHPALHRLLLVASLCNDALVTPEEGKLEIIGDPTEGALMVAAIKGGLDIDGLFKHHSRIHEIPFSSEHLFMATLHANTEHEEIFIKGAPEKILTFCSHVLTANGKELLTPEKRQKIEFHLERMSEKALRLIGCVTMRHHGGDVLDMERLKQNDGTFIGFLGMMDPPRTEAIDAIRQCKEAGIEVAMITGDSPITAKAIAEKLGIHTKGVLKGSDIKKLSDEQLSEEIQLVKVFARIEPVDKLKIVKAFQQKKHIVAMTGDGVNDAPALEVADIGIAMGISGTDVAKEAADMILTDDNFASVVYAIEEGRAIFNRLRSVTVFLLTTCFGELLGLILSVYFFGVAPLTPLQILWVNLVTGVILAIPLGLEPKTGRELHQPPRSPGVGLIFEGMIYRIIVVGTLLGLSIFGVFCFSLSFENIDHSRSIVLTALVVFEWLVAFNCRSDEVSIFQQGLFSNRYLILAIAVAITLHLMILYIPFLEQAFKVYPLDHEGWKLALIPGACIFLLESLRKQLLPTLFSYGKWKKGRRLRRIA